MSVRLRAAAGQTLDHRFRLIEEIGRGGMSTIFKAEDLQNREKPVAVKVPLPLFASGLGSWSMFQREEEIGLCLDHPYILKFVPLGIDKHRSYVVTEYVPGSTLAQRIAEQRRVPEEESLAIASQICEAIEYLHQQQIVHYDLKPGNIILCPDKTIRLIDFGLAHPVVEARFSFSGAPPNIGSSDYVAPEQIRRKRGRKSVDIYGLGATLYEMLTGRSPFPGDDPFVVASARMLGDPPGPRTLNAAISPEAEEIVLRALRRDPAERYASAAAMKADLDHLDRVVMSGICDRLQPVTRWRKLARWVRYVTLVGVFPLAMQVVLFFVLRRYLSHK